jgi:SHS2 domain-containing protein
MESPGEVPIEGVRPLEHTADVGLEVEADAPVELFRRAALGMTHLLLDHVPRPREDGQLRHLSLRSSDLPDLLREWLREVLHLHESEGFALTSMDLTLSEGWELSAELLGVIDPTVPIREIKGVTLHGLRAELRERDDTGGPEWYGRVIFDV